jgi:hypothetical protein
MLWYVKGLGIIHSPFPASRAAHRALGEDLAEDGVVFIFVDVVDADMSVERELMSDLRGCGWLHWCDAKGWDLPLKIVGAGVFVLLVWTEGTDVAWGVVDEAVAHHFIFALEAFSAKGARTAVYGTEVRAVLGVDVCVGAEGVDVRGFAFLYFFLVWLTLVDTGFGKVQLYSRGGCTCSYLLGRSGGSHVHPCPRRLVLLG